tara:strand:- start:1969 stop:2727 length:759 start_codon:yes stop_codon:yes gene_type:complete
MIDIKISNLNKSFLKSNSANKFEKNILQILKNFNLDIKHNEVLSIIGPSGTGKTTLLNILSGFDPHFTGNIEINREISGKKISFIFQPHNLLPWLTAHENVKLVSSQESLQQNRAYKILSELGLKDFINSYPNNLSGGMRRRVSIARAFVNNPSILLMDEPFVSLEKPLANQLRDLTISLIRKHKVTTLLVTHDLREAIMLSDRIIFCTESPMNIVLDKKIEISKSAKYESDEVENMYKEIMNLYPDILSAK